jgi:hypothetical protein
MNDPQTTYTERVANARRARDIAMRELNKRYAEDCAAVEAAFTDEVMAATAARDAEEAG